MANNWRVTGQRQTTTLDGNGRFQEVIEVSFETIPEATAGKVFIPLPMYAEDYVRSQIDARAATMQAIHNL